jgi:NAD(P)-dependent dehydrogenase (short-subunit alcohol dehydrogenase family)
VETKFGSIDTLVVNAGIFHLLPIEALSEEKFDETMNVNFRRDLAGQMEFIWN